MKRGATILIFILFLILTPVTVNAEETSAPASHSNFLDLSNAAVEFVVGSYSGSADGDQLSAPRNAWTLGLIFSADLTNHPQLGSEFALLWLSRDYDTTIPPPAWSTIDETMTLNTFSFAAGLRGYVPLGGGLRGYGVAGLAFNHSTMTAYGSTFGFPGEIEDTNNALTYYLGAGLEGKVGNYRLSVNYRHMPFDGSFSSFNVHSAGIGGEMLLLGIGSDL